MRARKAGIVTADKGLRKRAGSEVFAGLHYERGNCMKLILAVAIALVVANLGVRADEGMWLFNDPPRKLLKERHKFDVTEEWLEHVQKSSVRFNSGGSGSFVSEDGLIMSNHHVGADALQKLSTKENDYLKNGFQARSLDEEVPAKDLELNVLMSIENVTE